MVITSLGTLRNAVSTSSVLRLKGLSSASNFDLIGSLNSFLISSRVCLALVLDLSKLSDKSFSNSFPESLPIFFAISSISLVSEMNLSLPPKTTSILTVLSAAID